MKINPIHFYGSPGLQIIAPLDQVSKNTISHTSRLGYVYPVSGPAVIIKISREARALLERD